MPGLVGELQGTAWWLEAGVPGESLALGGPAELAEAGGPSDAMGPLLSSELP